MVFTGYFLSRLYSISSGCSGIVNGMMLLYGVFHGVFSYIGKVRSNDPETCNRA